MNERALCAETDPELFFPERGESTALAKKVCAMCLALPECKQSVLDGAEHHGVRAGMTVKEQVKYRKSGGLWSA